MSWRCSQREYGAESLHLSRAPPRATRWSSLAQVCVFHNMFWFQHSRFVTLDAGGHTTEMLRLLGGTARQRYSPRRYVLSNTDRISESKLQEFETGSSASDVCLLN